jgi:hypothetical protein
VLQLRGELNLANFSALELRDLVIQAAGPTAVVLQKNAELRLASVQIDRPHGATTPPTAALRVVGADHFSMTGCAVTTPMPAVAAVFQNISGDCRIVNNRFVGIVSFYGDLTNVPDPALQQRLTLPNRVPLHFGTSAGLLTFSDNTVSMLAVSSATMTALLANNSAAGLFASAVLHGNTLVELNNVFAANLLAFNANSFVAVPTPGAGGASYGVMLANTATASGNLAVQSGGGAILHFVTPDLNSFARAANRVFIQPLKNLADT